VPPLDLAARWSVTSQEQAKGVRIMIGNIIKRTLVALAITVAVAGSAAAQNSSRTPTNSKIEYHGGAVMLGTSDIYFIFYGCWEDTCGTAGDTKTMSLVNDFALSIGGTLYFQMNATYPGGDGRGPSGGLIWGGSVTDSSYSHGVELSVSDIKAIITEKLATGALPQDPIGIYVVVASADIGSAATGFCVPSAPPYHGHATLFEGVPQEFAFIGNPNRCPAVAAPQFFNKNGRQLPTPNGNLAGDAMASTLAHVLNNAVTDPRGDAWFDRNGLEASDKCVDQYGQTYLMPNGARANFHTWTNDDFLIQENWVNIGKGHCAMNSSQ
jgi:phosphate-induced protein 1